jgi:hypothetical protein
MQANQHNTLTAPNGQSTPLDNYCTKLDNAIERLLGFRARLMKAQMAGIETVDLEDPDSNQVYKVAISLAIEAVEFVATVKALGGAA